MDIRKSIVAICANSTLRQKGFKFAGTGFLTSAGLLITCAHVLEGAKQDGERFYFKHEPSAKEYTALRIAESPVYEWDAVILQPEALPADMQALPLWGGDELDGLEFATYGYIQKGGFEGLHARGATRGLAARAGDGLEFLQIATHDQRELDKGFSGAPLLVEGLGVVGVVKMGLVDKKDSLHDPRTQQDTTFAVPVRGLQSFYEKLVVETQPKSSLKDQGFVPEKLTSRDELPEPGQFPPGSRLPYHRNAAFTGRESDLLALANLLLAPPQAAANPTRAVVASGMGGIGKTQLAVEFCYRYGRFFHGVHWINAREGNLEVEIAACGREMGLPDFPETTPEQVALTLKTWQAQPARLVVLDNLEDEKLLSGWLPRLNGLRILITARRQQWSADLGLQVQALGTLPRADSLLLLRKLAPGLKGVADAGLEALAERLGDLPLALDLAGRYLDEIKTVSPQAFLDEIGKQGGALEHTALRDWAESNPTEHEINLAATFMLSWKQLDEKQELARTFFKAAGYLAPNIPIPRSIFEALGGNPGATALALRPLIRLGLLKDTLSIHRLLAEFARSQDNDSAVLRELADKMARECQRANETGIPADFAPLRAHLELLAPVAEQAGLADAGDLWGNLGYHQKMMAEYKAARITDERVLAIDEKTYGLEHPNVARRANNLGRVLQELGDLAGAKALYERALAIDEKTLGEEHPDVALIASNLGSVLKDLGDLAGAKAQFERALANDEKTFGPDHPDVATDANNLGSVLEDLGDLAGARVQFERALAIHEKAYGPEHPDVAIDANNLGTVLSYLGDAAGAKAQFERALAINEKAYGREHPSVATGANNLGMVLQDLGDLAGAKALYERALAIDEKTFGQDHRWVALRANNLGMVLKDMGDLAGAKAQLERALAIFQKSLPAGHKRIRITQDNLDVVDKMLKG
ncbi:MAG TPA: tetratricopeptide repeat protein [Anaerolineales bacterium]|jgi:tetratricopeptide (TPR) repeat protein